MQSMPHKFTNYPCCLNVQKEFLAVTSCNTHVWYACIYHQHYAVQIVTALIHKQQTTKWLQPQRWRGITWTFSCMSGEAPVTDCSCYRTPLAQSFTAYGNRPSRWKSEDMFIYRAYFKQALTHCHHFLFKKTDKFQKTNNITFIWNVL